MAKAAPLSTKLRLKLNLLYPQGLSEKLPLRFIKWLISYGRFIVIFVEIIVVTAFVFRFKLDADLDNLKRAINDEIPFVEGLSQDEAVIRQTQLRLSTINKNNAETETYIELFPLISKYVPQRVRFTSMTLDKDENSKLRFKVVGKTSSHVDLSSFVNNLKKEPKFNDINLDNVGFEQSEIGFTISGGIK